jgi:hypothetical protein
MATNNTFVNQPMNESSGYISTVTNFFTNNKTKIIIVIIVLVLAFLFYKFYLKDKYFMSKQNEEYYNSQSEQNDIKQDYEQDFELNFKQKNEQENEQENE